ncbi:hypothetical protein Q8A67_005174 [Cirrhinus molitorella]|uniref:Uncharacterized protein n=1 Tax=Cirrhinus molitorella TaxID=172907 RepID=A0AA88QE19_9TELE|nr:hypothetical protein Q8A67_005174 [Cirrhinus molitorella]
MRTETGRFSVLQTSFSVVPFKSSLVIGFREHEDPSVPSTHCTLHLQQSILALFGWALTSRRGHRSRLELGVATTGTGWRLSSAPREGGVTGTFRGVA